MEILPSSFLILVVANIGYHLCQKAVPSEINPLVLATFTYLIAGAASVSLLILFPPEEGYMTSVRSLHWSCAVLGLTLIGIEVGYLLLYRSGCAVSIGSVLTSTVVTVLLVPLGYLLFRERIQLTSIVGVACALLGIWLISVKK